MDQLGSPRVGAQLTGCPIFLSDSDCLLSEAGKQATRVLSPVWSPGGDASNLGRDRAEEKEMATTHIILFYGAAVPAEQYLPPACLPEVSLSLLFDHGPTSDPLRKASEIEIPLLLLVGGLSSSFTKNQLRVLALGPGGWLPASLPCPTQSSEGLRDEIQLVWDPASLILDPGPFHRPVSSPAPLST